jgi:hypothetical protein
MGIDSSGKNFRHLVFLNTFIPRLPFGKPGEIVEEEEKKWYKNERKMKKTKHSLGKLMHLC